MFDFAKDVIRRSRLIMPANENRFIEKAHERNADAIVLDLEDSVPEQEKANTRNYLNEIINIVGRGGSDVIVRINNTQSMRSDDIEAAIYPGLNSLYIPKVESANQMKEIDLQISKLEEEREIPYGQIKIGIIIETVEGYFNTKEIVSSSPRIESITLGSEDFSVDSGVEISDETSNALLIPRMNLLLIARRFRKLPLGLIGSITNYKELDIVEKNATLSYKHGFLGASCIHPSNVEVLNKCFSPTKTEYRDSLELCRVFEEALERGRASISFRGKMVDIAHYKKAKLVIDRYEKIQNLENEKERCRELVAKG